MGFLNGSAGKESTCNAGDIGDTGLIPGEGRFPGGKNANPLHYFPWIIPWTEEPCRLQSKGSQSQSDMAEQLSMNTDYYSILG